MTYFSTARLDVRRLTVADIAGFSAYRADPAVACYQSWDEFTHAQGEALVDSMRHLELGTPGEWFQLALEDRDRGVPVGDLACKVSALEPREMQIGFTLASHEQGRGYATEAVLALLDHAFTTMRSTVLSPSPTHATPQRPHSSFASACAKKPTSSTTSSSKAPGAASCSSPSSHASTSLRLAPRTFGSSTPQRPACSQEEPHDHR